MTSGTAYHADEIWELRVECVGATGLSSGRSVVDSAVARDRVLVHSAPSGFT